MDRWNGCPEYSSGECLVVLPTALLHRYRFQAFSSELNVLCFCCCSVCEKSKLESMGRSVSQEQHRHFSLYLS